jgi:hypothetical protein
MISIDQQVICPIYSPTWFSWTFLMAYFEAKLKDDDDDDDDKASPCFRTF